MNEHSNPTSTNSQKPQHIHFVGICGVAMGALAIAFHKAGWKVTGSDKGFFPPVSTYLEKSGISYYAGWHPEKMTAEGAPDIAVIGTASGTQNPETAYIHEHNIPFYSYPEIIGKYFIKEHSIVCCGTWGKTSSSTLLSYTLQSAGFDPSYMFGGIAVSMESSAKLAQSSWSVCEGDEYKSSPWDSRPKFAHYKPTHLLLTAISWDHADLYPTEQDYFNAFRTLIANIPAEGLIVACADNKAVQMLISDTAINKTKHVVTYGKHADAQYCYKNISQSQNGITFTIYNDTNTYKIVSPMLGTFQVENITACFAMAHSIGIKPKEISHPIARFEGLKRRLERRYTGTDKTGKAISACVIDDIAHSPEKAKSVLETLRAIYPSPSRVIAVFEPNIGSRRPEIKKMYDTAFANADEVVIPRLTKLKVSADPNEKQPMEADELYETIVKTQPRTTVIKDDTELVKYLGSVSRPGDCIAFLGSHGFRGMIEETINALTEKSHS